jgi:hypothetical protein
MKICFRNTSSAFAISTALILSACGGGGGGSSEPVIVLSSVTSANAPDVAANSFSSVIAFEGRAEIGPSLIFSSSAGSPNEATSKGVIDITLRQIYKGLAAKSADTLSIAATGTEEIACIDGGTITFTWTEAASNVVSNGDSMTVAANNCVQGSTRLNGSFTVSFSNISGTPSPSSAWSATLGLTYSNFTLSEGTESITVDGDMRNTVNQVNSSDTSYAIDGTSFALTETSGTTTVSETLIDYTYNGSYISGVNTFGANFTVSGTFRTIGNVAYAVTTTVPFKQTSGNYPYQGSMIVKGANNSAVKMNVIDNSTVQIEIDNNGDGTYEEVRTMAWSALENLL